MSAAQKPEGVQMIETAAVGTLPAAVQQQLELRKLSNQIAGKLSEMNWGKQLDHAMRRAIADWGRQYRVDVTTEIHVLGGNVYLNAAWYLRQLSELIAEGLVEYAYADHVEQDPRLAKMGPEGEGEITRRLRERLMHGIPDEAKSAVVFRVKLRSMEKEVTGSKWCGGGTRKNDPVGDQFPIETSESRAARRAMRQLVSHVPKARADEIQILEGSAEALSERVVDAQRAFVAKEQELNRPVRAMALPAGEDPYGPVATVAAPTKEPAPVEATSNTIDLMEALKTSLAASASAGAPSSKAPAAPSFADLTASITRLLKHERLSDKQRGEFTVAAADAKSEEDLSRIIEQLEAAIAGDGELGL